MVTSEHSDRERRRTKPETRGSWTKVLINPKTVTFLVAVGKFITLVMWLYYKLIKILRE